MIKKLLHTSWRFYFFQNDNSYYCFDCFTHKIYFINHDLYQLLKKFKYKDIKKQYSKFYKQILKASPFIVNDLKDDRCFVTVNFSNKCNLKCTYCYRKKDNEVTLSKESLRDIVQYVKNIYFPNASQYIFSLCYTSESSLDLEKLKYFDYLIGKYEGYLFSPEEISEEKIFNLLNRLPKEITKSHTNSQNSVDLINNILINEKLWEYYDYSKHEYLSSLLSQTKILSISKTIMVNRQILNYIFPELCYEKKIQYMSMSFMTNATNITKEYIDFLKSRFENTIHVSLDGPEEIHNSNRIYHDGTGTYQDVINGIEKLRSNGINVIPATVITPAFPDLNVIVEHFIKLGFKDISFNLVRGSNEITCFSFDSINKLITSIKSIYEEILLDFINDIISAKFIILKNSILFAYLRSIYYGKYITNRCRWGRSLVIDNKGNIYHCDSTIGYEADCLGTFNDKKTKKELFDETNVNRNINCIKCYAKYLCGGTCYAELIFNNEQNEAIECYYHKELINESIKMYTKLKEQSLIDKFMKLLSAE